MQSSHEDFRGDFSDSRDVEISNLLACKIVTKSEHCFFDGNMLFFKRDNGTGGEVVKRLLLLGLCLLMCFCCGCGNNGEKTEIIVFAAASLQETLTELGAQYMADHENVTVTFNFDSSGTLKTQILEGADCDVFISAGQKQMNELGDLPVDRFDILENKVALAVPAGNPRNIQSYDDMKKALLEGKILLAMGNADVPVGQYTQNILTFFGLREEDLAEKGVLTYGSNAREVTTQVLEGAVDCGIIYATDAFSAGLTVVDTATAEMCGQVIYPAAVMRSSRHQSAAQAFLDYLMSDIADAVFERVGFTPIP